MVCIEFPPVNTTGNYRSAGFAREFSKAGHEVEVITTTVGSGVDTFNKSTDNQLLDGLELVKIHRYPIKPISSFFSKGIGNALRIWWNTTDNINKRWYFGQNKIDINEVTRQFKPDLLYVSLPPFSCYSVALDLQKAHQLKLVTDMRDAWSLWATSPYPTRFHYKKVKRLEQALFSSSSLILGVTNEMVDDFKNQHREINSDKYRVVFNGYDPPPTIGESVDTENSEPNNFKVGYVGSFYYDPQSEELMSKSWFKRPGLKKFWYSPRKEFWEYRSPHYFLKALALYNRGNPERCIRFEFVGKLPDWLHHMVNRLGLEDNFLAYGFKSKSEVLAIQSTWHAILATSERIEHKPHFCLPSKIFDAIESGKRILAFVTPGAQLDFLKDYSQTVFFEPDSVENNAEKLVNLIESEDGFQPTPLKSNFYREEQSKKLLEIIEEAL